MKTKKIELGDVFYVFTNWGICKGRIIRIENSLLNNNGYDYFIDDGDEIPTMDDGTAIDEFEVCQYKLNIDIDEDNKNLKYGFFYVEDQLYNSPQDAINDMKEKFRDK